MAEKLAVLLVEQEMSLANILNPAQFIRPQFVLKKLALWGEEAKDDEIDFQWPSEETLLEVENLKNLRIK